MDSNENNLVDRLPDRPRPTETKEWRIDNLERHNQLKKLSSEDGKTFFDTENGLFMMSDGANNRVVMDGNSIKVSQAGYDADVAPSDKLVMSSDFNMLKVAAVFDVSHTVVAGEQNGYTHRITHNLGYTPVAIGSMIYTDGSKDMLPLHLFFLLPSGGYNMTIPYSFRLGNITNTTIDINFEILTVTVPIGTVHSFRVYLLRETVL